MLSAPGPLWAIEQRTFNKLSFWSFLLAPQALPLIGAHSEGGRLLIVIQALLAVGACDPGGPVPSQTVKGGAQQKNAIIDFTTDFKSIVKSRHDFTVKSSALDLRLLSNQLRINDCFSLWRHTSAAAEG